MAEKYVCTLRPDSLKKAQEELNEIPEDRMSSVERFRKLIKERAPHITCSLDSDFLLRFLRIAKFSQLEALKRLEKYLNMFNAMPEWMRDIDTTNKRQLDFLDTGYYVPLGVNDEGQQVNLFDFGCYDTKSKKYDKKDIFRAMFGLMIHQITCEDTLVNGFSGLADFTTFTVKHQAFWTLDDMKKMGDLVNGAFPARWKGFHYYNHGPIFQVLWNMFQPFLKKKVKDRLFLIGDNLEVVYDKKIPMRLLPIEYLPDDYTGPNNGHLKDLIQKLKEELTKPEVVAKIKYETGDAFRLDESKRLKNDVPLQSFRKLNVD